MSGSSSPIRSGSPSSVQDFYAVAQRLSENEKGKEEEESDVGLQSEPLPLMHQLRSNSPARASDDDEYLSGVEEDSDSEPLPLTHQFSIHQISREVLVHILNFLTGPDQPGAAENLYTIQRVCHLWKGLSDLVLERHWNNHCNHPEASLYPFAHAIEERIRGNPAVSFYPFTSAIEERLRDFKRIESFDFSYFFRFQVLTKKFGQLGALIPKEDPKTAFQPPLGLQPLQYVQAHQALDAALAKIAPRVLKQKYTPGNPGFLESEEAFHQFFKDHPPNAEQAAAFAEMTPRILKQIYVPGDLVLVGAKAFRQWLNHPEHAARIARITQLDLSNLELKILPPEIGKFIGLESLDLNGNQLTDLPGTIGNLTELRKLSLDKNPLKSFPDIICKLTELRELSLSETQLASLPDTFGELNQLQCLDLGENQLILLPNTIGNLTRLYMLILIDNRLSCLPSTIGECTQLNWLFLSNNQLTSLPDTIGKLAHLHFFYLNNNQLTYLPDTIGNLTDLREWILDSNPLISTFNKNLSEVKDSRKIDLIEFMERRSACSTYLCQSSFGALCQGIHCGVNDEALREHFEALSPQMQQQIRNKWAATPSSSSSSSEAGEDLFADRALFARSVISVLREKLGTLSQEEKNLIYQRVWELAGQPRKTLRTIVSCLRGCSLESAGPREYTRCGELLATQNIIRFIDAIELVTA